MVETLPLIVVCNYRKQRHEKIYFRRYVSNVIRGFFHRLPEVMYFLEFFAELDGKRCYAGDTGSTA